MHVHAGILVGFLVLALFLIGGFLWQAIDIEEFPHVPAWCRPQWLCRLVGIPWRISPHGK